MRFKLVHKVSVETAHNRLREESEEFKNAAEKRRHMQVGGELVTWLKENEGSHAIRFEETVDDAAFGFTELRVIRAQIQVYEILEEVVVDATTKGI